MKNKSNTKKRLILFLVLQIVFLAVISITAYFYYWDNYVFAKQPVFRNYEIIEKLTDLNYLVASVSTNTRDLILQKEQEELFENYENAIDNIGNLNKIASEFGKGNLTDEMIDYQNDFDGQRKEYVLQVEHVLRLGEKGELDEAREIILTDLAESEEKINKMIIRMKDHIDLDVGELEKSIQKKNDEIMKNIYYFFAVYFISFLLGIWAILSFKKPS
jgi:CHASE3 domain sensor protein